MAVDPLRGCLKHLCWHLGADPANAVLSRVASYERFRTAAVSAALGCYADTYGLTGRVWCSKRVGR